MKKQKNRYADVPIIIESTNKNGDCSEILKQGFKIILRHIRKDEMHYKGRTKL